MTKYKLIGPITQLISMNGLPLKGALKDEQLPVIFNAGILTEGEHIHSIGNYTDLKEIASSFDSEIIELQSNYVCLPGFIDSHTHICFSGSRANDYAMRNSGKSYLEIAEAGGGIWDTVTNTRTASQEELCHGVVKRANLLLKNGITTIEVKSGYGLSVTEELKMLRAIKEANLHLESDLISTCLAAHMLPKDYDGDHQEYLNEIASTLFPILKEEKLTNRIDAFVEQSAFSKENIEPYFKKATEMGFDITVHADQFTPGGSEIAVKVNAVSADHLEASTDTEIKTLAESDVISVALPGASIGLGCDFTPARKILDAGGALSIASDWNPGSAPMGDLLTQACILGTFQKLSNAEVLAGITTRAAAALKLKDRGKLAPRMLADFCLFSTDNFNEILYHQGKLTPSQVWKCGDAVYIEH
ncbi:imidazolonepropionase [Aquimarina sp. BL5]|uniref:imidazolonepropionase n=1 Tax=Aquimarina sp. BL5 TaxID=1714860 RepID=UPI000E538D55|nr:imidazolonepropionase [Aquimarina sp. BL5]AXT49365.1 imidazolonepropionase [Aquimarina sp. BL5]RKM98430.1 imidazolonepropionase [Aquimarina sp. BL5]